MGMSKHGRNFFTISGICFFVPGVWLILFWPHMGGDIFVVCKSVFGGSSLIALAILLHKGKKDNSLVITSGITVAAMGLNYGGFVFAAYGLLFLIFLLNAMPSFHKAVSILNKLWFLPGALCMIVCISRILYMKSRYSSLILIWTFTMHLFFVAVAAVGMLLAGLWVKEDFIQKKFEEKKTQGRKV